MASLEPDKSLNGAGPKSEAAGWCQAYVKARPRTGFATAGIALEPRALLPPEEQPSRKAAKRAREALDNEQRGRGGGDDGEKVKKGPGRPKKDKGEKKDMAKSRYKGVSWVRVRHGRHHATIASFTHDLAAMRHNLPA